MTKLVPTALRVRRDEKGQKLKKQGGAMQPGTSIEPTGMEQLGQMVDEPTKDDVYSNFMKEMEGFL